MSYQRPREQKLCKLMESSSVTDCLSIFQHVYQHSEKLSLCVRPREKVIVPSLFCSLTTDMWVKLFFLHVNVKCDF